MTSFSISNLPDEPIFVYHLSLEENKESIKENGLQPNYNQSPNSVNPTASKIVDSYKDDIDTLITKLAAESSKYPNINREESVYFWVNKETVVEKANSLMEMGLNPVIIGFKYELSSESRYLADMHLFTEAVDRYLWFKDEKQYTLRDYSGTEVSKEMVVSYLIQYLETVRQITSLQDVMNGLELYQCPELLVQGPVESDNLYFFEQDT